MNKICYLTATIAVFTLTLFSCGKDDSTQTIEDSNTIVGEWQLLTSTFSVNEDGDTSTDVTDHEKLEKPSIVTFSDDGKVDIIIYSMLNDTLSSHRETGRYTKKDDTTLSLTLTEVGEDEPYAINFERYKIEGNQLTFYTVERYSNTFIEGYFVARRIK